MELFEDSNVYENIKDSTDSVRQRNILRQCNKLFESITSKKNINSFRRLSSVVQGQLSGAQNKSGGKDDIIEGYFEKSFSLGYVLLHVISDDDAAELCRERAADCLKLMLCAVQSCSLCLDEKFLVHFYTDLCFVIAGRFGVLKESTINCQKNLFKTRLDDLHSKTHEKSEEIRLILIQMMSDILKIIHRLVLHEKNVNTFDDKNKGLILPSNILCQVLGKAALVDPYPELRRESCNLLKNIVAVVPVSVTINEECLLSSILGSSSNGESNSHKFKDSVIRHRHAKTRSLALETVTEIMRCHETCKNSQSNLKARKEDTELQSSISENVHFSSFIETLSSKVIPHLEMNIPLFDHSASVRGALVSTVGNLLRQIIPFCFSIKKFESRLPHSKLLVLLLIGLSDEVELVKRKALVQLSQSAKTFLCAIGNTLYDEVSNSSVLYIQACLEDIITLILGHISGQSTIQSTTRYFQTLATTIKILSHHHEVSRTDTWTETLLTNIISRICHSLLEDDVEQSLFDAAFCCAKSLGMIRKVRHSVVRIIEVSLKHEENHEPDIEVEDLVAKMTVKSDSCNSILVFSTAEQSASAINLIGGLMQGWKQIGEEGKAEENCYAEELRSISHLLASKKVIESAHCSHDAAVALLGSCHALANLVEHTLSTQSLDIAESDEWISDLTWCCINLIACPKEFKVSESTLDLLRRFSTQLPNIASWTHLLDLKFEFLLSKLINKTGETFWTRGDPNLNTFDALIRTSKGTAIVAHLNKLLPIFENHLAQECCQSINGLTIDKEELLTKFSTRIFFMALVESIVTKPSLPREEFFPFVERILDIVVLPNLVWQVGGMASALRKVSAAVLFAILHGKCTTDEIVFKVAPRLLPIVKANLSDDDSSLRELSISSMKLLLERLHNKLGEEAVNDLYPDLMKCLDDSSESVRFETCDALIQFLQCSSKSSYHGTLLNYMTELLFVHLDDPSPSLKEKVFQVLLVTLKINSQCVVKVANLSISSHSSRHYCDLLLHYAKEYE